MISRHEHETKWFDLELIKVFYLPCTSFQHVPGLIADFIFGRVKPLSQCVLLVLNYTNTGVYMPAVGTVVYSSLRFVYG